MSAAPSKIVESQFVAPRPRGSRRISALKVVVSDPREKEKGNQWTASPNALRALGRDHKIAGLAQMLLIQFLQELLWGGTKNEATAWTKPLSYKEISTEIGLTDTKQVQTIVKDAADRGIIAIRPAGQLYEFAVPFANWNRVPRWDAPDRKPAARAESAEVGEQKADPGSALPGFSLQSERSPLQIVPRETPIIMMPGAGAKPIPFEKPVSVARFDVTTESRAPVGFSAHFLAGTLHLTLHDGILGEEKADPGNVLPGCFDKKQQLTDIQAQVGPVFARVFHKPLDQQLLQRTAAELGDCPPARLAKLLESRAGGKGKIGSGMLPTLSKEAAAAWSAQRDLPVDAEEEQLAMIRKLIGR